MKLKGKKVLCVCGMGISRSNTLMIMLKTRGITDSLAIGATYNSPETLQLLGDWADVIILTVKELLTSNYPPEWKDKTIIFDVGPDRYFDPNKLHPELVSQFNKYLKGYL